MTTEKKKPKHQSYTKPLQQPGTNEQKEVQVVPKAKPHLCSTKLKHSQSSCQGKPEEKPEWSQACKQITARTRKGILCTSFLEIMLTWPTYYPDASYDLVLMLTRNLAFTKVEICKGNKQSAEEEFIPGRQLTETLMHEIKYNHHINAEFYVMKATPNFFQGSVKERNRPRNLYSTPPVHTD